MTFFDIDRSAASTKALPTKTSPLSASSIIASASRSSRYLSVCLSVCLSDVELLISNDVLLVGLNSKIVPSTMERGATCIR